MPASSWRNRKYAEKTNPKQFASQVHPHLSTDGPTQNDAHESDGGWSRTGNLSLHSDLLALHLRGDRAVWYSERHYFRSKTGRKVSSMVGRWFRPPPQQL